MFGPSERKEKFAQGQKEVTKRKDKLFMSFKD
jgi:hypothetical protein